MTYQQTLDWMFAQLPMYQQLGKKAFNAKLNGIKLLSQRLGNPQQKFKSIHVAGTNGKGSSSHMLASILQEAGYKVGLYTSPHLKDYRERIRIQGKPVSEKFVTNFIGEHKAFLEENRFSFFEMTVGLAFTYFAKEQVDIAVIEVGLGGRLDSTNIIAPEVSLITNIGMDHTDMLGDTLVKIAFEKAGIIKEHTPVVISEYQEDVIAVFEEVAEAKNAKLLVASENEYPRYKTSLLGQYQKKNINGVLAVINELDDFIITESHIAKGLMQVVENTGLMGRWQQLGVEPKIICDTAHNTEGLQLVLHQLENEKYQDLHIVLGFVKDKNLEGILPLFPQNATYYFCKPAIERGLSEINLKQYAKEYNLMGDAYKSVSEAYLAAKQHATKRDLIFVGGSNFIVAEVV
ncbi:bifunctional folylpolyglutamate synthase/dihydrofolate synthase [Maribacter sp. CXY002]|uniref:bifunctional folylpolyglutamate synthase/dihydrofolate synthase n=1 Tax=Maribacter luteocoastalis TaxID=3407671 RepID=UPI003B66C1B9